MRTRFDGICVLHSVDDLFEPILEFFFGCRIEWSTPWVKAKIVAGVSEDDTYEF